MANVTTSPETDSHDTVNQAHSQVLEMFWGAVMLWLFALWLGFDHGEIVRAPIILLAILGALTFAFAMWRGIALIRTATVDRPREVDRQRRFNAPLILVGGALFLAIAIGLVVKLGWAGFAQEFGLSLFALLTLLRGIGLLRRDTRPDGYLDFICDKCKVIGLIFILGGLAALAVTAYTIFISRTASEHNPEIFIFALWGLVLGGLGMWFVTQNPDDLTRLKARQFILILGGSTGLLLFLWAVAKAYLWREDVLVGGLAAWQGENGWRFWTCAYVGTIGLIIMFVSVLIVRGDVRSSASLRRLLFGYNTVVTSLILLAMLFVLNIVVYAKLPFKFEWTKNSGITTLSPRTKNIIAGLKHPLNLYVLLSQRDLAFEDMQNLLGNMQAISDKVKVTYASPNRDYLIYQDLAKRFPEITPFLSMGFQTKDSSGVLVVDGDLPKDVSQKVPYAFIPTQKIVDFVQSPDGNGGSKVFKGEVELMKEISYLQKGQQKRKIYFLQGDDELDLNSKAYPKARDPRLPLSQLGAFKLTLNLEQDYYAVAGLSFGLKGPDDKSDNMVYALETGSDKRKEVPADAWALAILGPSKRMPKETLDALERYMDRGGRLFVSFDVVTNRTFNALLDSGLEEFVKKYGVTVGNEFVTTVMADERIDPNMAIAFTPPTSENAVSKQFKGQLVQLDTVRVVRPDTESSRYKAEPLLQTEPRQPEFRTIVESNLIAVSNPLAWRNGLIRSGQIEQRFAKDPVPVALTVTESGKPRMVVFGDTEFLANRAQNEGEDKDLLYALFVSSLEWMAEHEELGGIRPRESSMYAISKGVDFYRMTVLPGWLMTLAIFGLGTGIWIARRR